MTEHATLPTETLDEAIAKAEAQAAALKARRDAAVAAERPAALARTLEVIRRHAFTKAELDPAMRKRPFVPKPRKAKAPAGLSAAAAVAPGIGNGAAAQPALA